MHIYESVRRFLDAQAATHPNPRLLDFATDEMEFQINVAAGNGHRVPGKASTYSDGLNDWWSIRSPRDADSVPVPLDYELRWPLELHASEIGLTGWNHVHRRSDWIGFDFDSVTSHAPGIGITAEQLAAVEEAAKQLPYVEVRRSTGGDGLHFAVFLEGIYTANHAEHAAVARAVLGKMSAATGFNFGANVDACGQVLWVWARRQSPRSFQPLKAAEGKLTLADVPNWRDHLDVVMRKRAKARVGAVPDCQLDTFEALASAHRVVPLEQTHKDHMDELLRLGFSCVWDADRHMVQTHTAGFKRLHEEMKLEGFFDTNSPGSDPGTPNCFAFPGDFGSWKIYRFGPGVSEARTWEQSPTGYTTCWVNRKPNLKAAARALGGRDLKRGGHELDTLQKAAEVAQALGYSIEVDPTLAQRKAIVSTSRDGRLTVEVAKHTDDKVTGGWNDSDKKHTWTQVFDVPTEPVKEDVGDVDHVVRCLKTPEGKAAGWRIKQDDGQWKEATASSVKTVLQSLGHSKPLAEMLMGVAERRPWTLVKLPFHPEYPGPRQWNLNAPQYRYAPAVTDDPDHPTWDLFLQHLWQGLDSAVQLDPWCKEHGIGTGADWLLLYYAAMLRMPFCRLPYAGFWGPGDSGKSSAYEVFSLLVTGGVVDGKDYLAGRDMFNADLESAVLVYIDEHDLSGNAVAANKVKELVTGLEISVRRMRTDRFQQRSTFHLMHLTNFVGYFATTTGDCRAVIAFVPRPETEIAKGEFHERLKAEAPHFMRTVMDLRFPPAPNRMQIPVLDTDDKQQLLNEREPLAGFLELCELDPAAITPKADLLSACNAWLEGQGRPHIKQTKLSTFLTNVSGGKINIHAKLSVEGRRVNAVAGIRLKGRDSVAA